MYSSDELNDVDSQPPMLHQHLKIEIRNTRVHKEL